MSLCFIGVSWRQSTSTTTEKPASGTSILLETISDNLGSISVNSYKSVYFAFVILLKCPYWSEPDLILSITKLIDERKCCCSCADLTIHNPGQNQNSYENLAICDESIEPHLLVHLKEHCIQISPYGTGKEMIILHKCHHFNTGNGIFPVLVL